MHEREGKASEFHTSCSHFLEFALHVERILLNPLILEPDSFESLLLGDDDTDSLLRQNARNESRFQDGGSSLVRLGYG